MGGRTTGGCLADREMLAGTAADRPSPFYIPMPVDGWRDRDSFSAEEKAKLWPIAETLAMLDGNAFFSDQRFTECYLPEAHALYEANGGDNGWAGMASFVQKPAVAAGSTG